MIPLPPRLSRVTSIYCIRWSRTEPTDNLPARIYALFGEPNENITVAVVHQMTSRARESIVVGFSGIGGDELFGGYLKYQFLHD